MNEEIKEKKSFFILCSICGRQIKGRYIIKEEGGSEDYYHPRCDPASE